MSQTEGVCVVVASVFSLVERCYLKAAEFNLLSLHLRITSCSLRCCAGYLILDLILDLSFGFIQICYHIPHLQKRRVHHYYSHK